MKRRQMTIIRLALLAVTMPFMGCVHTQGQVVEGISSKVEVVKGEFKKTEPVEIRFAITNTTDKQVNFLKWGTPLEGFNSNIFLVKRDGAPVTYIGRVVKRGTPQAEDYVSIAPGETLSTDVDLSQAYEIYETGEYSVEFKSRIFDIGDDAVAKLAVKPLVVPQAISSNTVSFRLLERRERPIRKSLLTTEQIEAKTPVFRNCTQAEQNTINAADGDARSLSGTSYETLTRTRVNKRSTCERYTYWFGTYDGTRYDTVTNHFLKIRDAFANQTVTYNCNCDPKLASAYAYVYPDSPYEIFLCNAFWTAPATGTDSQFGTLVHEMSHFNVVAATDDHAYGQAAAHNLATTKEADAIDNADNHEYFCENTPLRQCDSGHAGYTFCADENQSCSFSGTKNVAYGANGTFTYQTATNGINCNNATFGDPIVGVVKACYIGPEGYSHCAAENGTCSFSGTKKVAYGANGTFTYKTATNGISCNNDTFGDPIVGVVKACYTKDSRLGDVVVPDVESFSFTRAKKAIEEAGLEPRFSCGSNCTDEYHVIGQRPAPDTEVRPGSQVYCSMRRGHIP